MGHDSYKSGTDQKGGESMKTEEKLKELFMSLCRTKKVEFISDNIDYASDRAIVKHVGAYICDILEDLWEDGDIDGVIAFLKNKGYKVEGTNV